MVIGDVMIDSYLWGKVERISPEAPVPVINCLKKENRLGGAANVALNLQALDAHTILCGIIGNDDAGTIFLKLMQDNHLDNNGITLIQNRATTIKTRVIGGNQQLLRIDEETDKPIIGEDEIDFINHINTIIGQSQIDAIIFQDYDKGSLTAEVIKQVTQQALKSNIPVLVDPKSRNFHNYKHTTLFKPNFKEFSEGVKTELSKNDIIGLFEAAKKFQSEHDIKLLMITLSEKGIFISDQKQYKHIPAHIRDITDVSGAGDTVISVASLCMASGMNPAITAAISNLSGGLVCEKVGVVSINKKRLLEEALLLDFSELL
jgi:rfaE bifunctional protein kinase chain/domain